MYDTVLILKYVQARRTLHLEIKAEFLCQLIHFTLVGIIDPSGAEIDHATLRRCSFGKGFSPDSVHSLQDDEGQSCMVKIEGGSQAAETGSDYHHIDGFGRHG